MVAPGSKSIKVRQEPSCISTQSSWVMLTQAMERLKAICLGGYFCGTSCLFEPLPQVLEEKMKGWEYWTCKPFPQSILTGKYFTTSSKAVCLTYVCLWIASLPYLEDPCSSYLFQSRLPSRVPALLHKVPNRKLRQRLQSRSLDGNACLSLSRVRLAILTSGWLSDRSDMAPVQLGFLNKDHTWAHTQPNLPWQNDPFSLHPSWL